MKKILFFITALLLMGGLNANAEKKYADLSKLQTVPGTAATWDSETNTIAWTAGSNNLISNFDFGFSTPYDLSDWETISVTITSLTGSGIRLQMKADGAESNPFELKAVGTHTFNVADFTIRWTSNKCDITKVDFLRILGLGDAGSAVISEVYLERPDDPLAIPKDNLRNAINKGKLQNSFAKTAASFKVLTDAVADGEDELAKPLATAESLNDATKAITDAIAGLKHQAGYARVTKNMFMQWDGDGADAKALGVSPAAADNIGVPDAGVPYGYSSGNVYWNHYTDMTPYQKLYALGTPAGKRARYLFNRPMNPENPSGEGTAAFIQKYVDIDENGIAELDLSEVSTEFVHLNTFKMPDGGTTFTDFIVYAAKTKAVVGADGYATFSSIMNVNMTGVTAYAAKVNGAKVELTPVTKVPANTAVIIEANAGTYELTNIESADAIANNDLLISDGSIAGDGSTIYVLAKGDKGIGFYLLKSGNKVEAGKAYLQIGGSARGFIGFEGATGINEVNVNKAAVKTGKIYNLNGQIVSKPSKGLFIVDGKVVSF